MLSISLTWLWTNKQYYVTMKENLSQNMIKIKVKWVYFNDYESRELTATIVVASHFF